MLLLEQFELGHGRGSSHGESRIIRHSYTSADYASLAPAAFERWRALERESGARLLTMTGGIDIGRPENAAMAACREALATAGIGSVWLEGEAARVRPAVRSSRGLGRALAEQRRRYLNAGRCVRALVAQAIAHGATLSGTRTCDRHRTRPASISRPVRARQHPKPRCERARCGGRGWSVGEQLACRPWRRTAPPGDASASRVLPGGEPEPVATRQECPVYIAHGRGGLLWLPCLRTARVHQGRHRTGNRNRRTQTRPRGNRTRRRWRS